MAFPLRGTTALKEKALLLIFGAMLAVFFLEAALRLAGFAVLSLQEHRNRASLKNKDTYRIICLGESTTQMQYPSYLEESLNRSGAGIRFSVIDKGVAGTNSGVILSHLEEYLKEYRPDMVVAMIGINDQGVHLPQESATVSSAAIFFRSFRVYKLVRLLGLHIASKIKAPGRQDIAAALRQEPDDALTNKSSGECIELGKSYRSQGDFSRAERAYRKALELDTESDKPLVELAWFYKERGNYPESERLFKKALELNPRNDDAYAGLGWFYKMQGDLAQSILFLGKALELNPSNTSACVELGSLYRFRENYPAAIDLFLKALKINPGLEHAYNELAWIYKAQGDYARSEQMYKKALKIDPANERLYAELGFIYREQSRYRDLEELFRQAVRYKPQDDWGYGALQALYEETGNTKLAKEYARKTRLLRTQHAYQATAANYRKLKQILDKHGVRLVSVQYPMRNMGPLRALFDDTQGIIFVDNEKVFKDAISRGGRAKYFLDMFGGDFGHCSSEGNKLLAENIARQIISGVFKK
ncbi:MAG: tetratricopeptide repeat protein [Candidatus Omnitrophica bacterium]|nr:tetratricopeptide repeat protein [Candidatus Omnitrophota bacterium]